MPMNMTALSDKLHLSDFPCNYENLVHAPFKNKNQFCSGLSVYLVRYGLQKS